MFLSHEKIEHIAEAVLRDFEHTVRGVREGRGVPIDRLACEYLGLSVSFAQLSADGSVLGITAYGDTEFDTGERVIHMKRNQVLLDMSLLSFSDNRTAVRRKRFTLAHECAHQILFALNAVGTQPVTGKPYSLCMARKSRREWQADALGAALLMPAELVGTVMCSATQGRVIRSYGGRFTLGDRLLLDRLCLRFRVSRTALAIRLRELGYIERRPACEFYDAAEVCA